ncbi:type II toxin-antitoxin system ParD family antitoxin [Methylobacterium sp. J-088]|uniref:type II toxin-antitoxin system ParD family antitoxin n=1 Tax=Methylobacterium sp. J-088 TaxID=2836664 RepID=UPI001FBADBD9|nr:type II toxin-antitoxin system ParD family antitoxin [Methylobacterium sp. J-088]MCJ2062100.1 type II toxin-antitoxin system ParD family antitoxin [Methylobacterium sp. J-088]
MAATEKRTFSLTAERAAFIDAQVRAGAFASASEVVRPGLRALQERDAAVACWLRDEVAATYDAMKAHRERLISADEMAERMRQRHEARMRDGT